MPPTRSRDGSPMNGPTLVVFDMDGVLVDSREANVEAFSYALEQLGHGRPAAGRVTELIGKPARQMLLDLGCPEDRVDQALHDYVNPRFMECLPSLARAMPGARETLKGLVEDGCLVGVCTSGTRAVQEPLLRQTGLLEFVHRLQTPCRSEHRKPHPEYLHELVREFPEPARIFHVEDTEEGVQMGRLGGAVTIFAEYGYGNLTREQADHRIGHVRQVREIVQAAG